MSFKVKYFAAAMGPHKPPTGGTGKVTYNVSILFLLTVLTAVLIAVWSATLELGFLLTILVLPPLIRTALVVRLRQQRFPREILGMSQKALLFVVSFFVTLSCCASTLFCSMAAAIGSGLLVLLVLGEGDFAIILAMLTAGVCGIGITVISIILSAKWIILRWERDTQAPSPFDNCDPAMQQ